MGGGDGDGDTSRVMGWRGWRWIGADWGEDWEELGIIGENWGRTGGGRENKKEVEVLLG